MADGAQCEVCASGNPVYSLHATSLPAHQASPPCRQALGQASAFRVCSLALGLGLPPAGGKCFTPAVLEVPEGRNVIRFTFTLSGPITTVGAWGHCIWADETPPTPQSKVGCEEQGSSPTMGASETAPKQGHEGSVSPTQSTSALDAGRAGADSSARLGPASPNLPGPATVVQDPTRTWGDPAA